MADPKTSWQSFVREFRTGSHADFAKHWRRYKSLCPTTDHDIEQPPVWWPDDTSIRHSNLSALLRETALDESAGDPADPEV